MRIYIGRMTESQSNIYHIVSSKADLILENLIRLLMYPADVRCEEWKCNIYSALNRVPTLNNNKLPKPDLIFRALSSYNNVADSIMWQIDWIEKSLTPVNLRLHEIIHVAERYQHWLADELSADGIVIPDNVYSELDSILRESR